MHYKTLTLPLLIATMLLFSGCIYRLTIEQGNIVSEETAAKLKIGMSKYEVINLLGSPILDNAFEDNRWYYIYTKQKGNQKMLKKGYILYFSGSRLERIIKE